MNLETACGALWDNHPAVIFTASSTRRVRRLAAAGRSRRLPRIVGLGLWLTLVTLSALGPSSLLPPTAAHDNQLINIYLTINQTNFVPGDELELHIDEWNMVDAMLHYERYVILEAFGSYYFWPTWGTQINFMKYLLKRHDHRTDMILHFQWPSGIGSIEGLVMWAAANYDDDDPNTYEVLDVDNIQFSFSEPFTPTPDSNRTATPTPVISPTPNHSPTPSPTPDHYEFSFSIAGNASEQSTGIYVSNDEMVSINAWGSVCFHTSICDQTTVGPNGYPEQCNESECNTQPFAPTTYHAALVSRLDGGSYFLVGERTVFFAAQTGEIKLAINDGILTDNDGAFDGIIYVYP